MLLKEKNQIVSCSAARAHNHLPLPPAGRQSPQSAVAPALLQPLSTIDPARATISGPLTNIPLSVTDVFARRPYTLLYNFRLSKPVSGRKEKKATDPVLLAVAPCSGASAFGFSASCTTERGMCCCITQYGGMSILFLCHVRSKYPRAGQDVAWPSRRHRL